MDDRVTEKLSESIVDDIIDDLVASAMPLWNFTISGDHVMEMRLRWKGIVQKHLELAPLIQMLWNMNNEKQE